MTMTPTTTPLSRFLVPFASSLVQRNCAKRTQQIYLHQIRDFIAYTEASQGSLPTLADFDLLSVDSYLGHLSTENKKPKTIALARTVLQSFASYLVRKQYIASNPVDQIPAPRLPKPLPKPLKPQELQALIGAVDRSTTRGKRDYAILLMFILSGLRIAELSALQLHDVDFANNRIEVRHGKGDKDRYVPMPSALVDALHIYLQESRPHYDCASDSHALWLSRQGNLKLLSIREIVYCYRDKAGLDYRKLSPHILRATYATLVAQACQGDLLIVRDLLGHANIQTTTVYVEVSQQQKNIAVESLSQIFAT